MPGSRMYNSLQLSAVTLVAELRNLREFFRELEVRPFPRSASQLLRLMVIVAYGPAKALARSFVVAFEPLFRQIFGMSKCHMRKARFP